MSPASIAPFNIQAGNELTLNVQPIMHQIRHALDRLLADAESGIIDLRSIPLAPGEEDDIIDRLGQGEVHARLNVLGPSEIYETRHAGVWLITHYNENEEIVSRFIEITSIPEILKSQPEDMSVAAKRLAEELG